MSLPLSVYKRLPKQLPLSLGFSRYALRFTGANFVEVPYNPSFQFGTGDFTIEILIRTTEVPPVAKHFIGTYNDVAVTPVYAIVFTTGGSARVWIRDTEGDSVAFDIGIVNDGKWRHLALVRTATVLYGYNNLVEYSADASAVGDTSNAYNLWLMRVWDYYIEGDVALARLYNRALSKRELHYNMLNYHSPIRDGLICWLDLEEGRGLKAYDKSGYGNDGDLLPATNPPTWIRNKMWELRSEVGL